MFISNKNRRRQRFIDQVIESGYNTLTNPEVVQRLGASAVDLLDIHSRLFVPKVTAGDEVRIPLQQRQQGGIPIIALSPKESVYISNDLYELTPRQRASAIEVLQSKFPNADPDKSLDLTIKELQGRHGSQSSGRLKRSVSQNEAAIVYTMSTKGDPQLTCWPMIVLNYDQKDNITMPDYGPIFVHEATHVVQLERDSVLPRLDAALETRRDQRGELEAMAAGAQALAGLRASGLECTDPVWQCTIDDIRKEANAGSIDPMAATPDVIRGLRAAGIVHKLLTM